MKLALDQTTDYSHRELYNFLKDINVPDYVKQAELDVKEDLAKLSKEAFADQWNRAFPIHKADSVYLSNAYFVNKKAELKKIWGDQYVDSVEEKIKTAADILNIHGDIEAYNKEAQERNNKSYATEHIYSVKLGDDEVDLYPVATQEDFQKAASTFVKTISTIPFAWRQDIAQNFIKAASKFGVDEIPDLICKYAGMYYPNVPEIKTELWYRSTKLNKEADKKNYEDLIKDVDNISSTDEVFKLAEVVHYIEKMAGLYDVPEKPCILKDPVDAFFTLSVEKVASIMNVVEMAGSNYDIDDLKKVSSDLYKEAFGIDVDPNDESTLREVLPTMPRSDVSLFREISGIEPIS